MDNRSQEKSSRGRTALLAVLVGGVIAALALAAVAVTQLGHQAGGVSTAQSHTPDSGAATGGGAGEQGAGGADEGNPAAGGPDGGAASPGGQGRQGGQGGQGGPKNPGNPKNPGDPKNPGGPKPPWLNNPTVPIIDGDNLPTVKPKPFPQGTPPPGKDKAKV